MEWIHPLDQIVKSIVHNGIRYDIVERPDVFWVGCLDYAANRDDEADGETTLNRFRNLLNVEKRELINPAWSAAIWANYDSVDQPRGLMFGQETYSDNQDARYEVLKQPAGLWLRLRRGKETSLALFGSESIDAWDYFSCGEMRKAAEANGYAVHPDVFLWIGYNCHEEYGTPPYSCYAYLPIA